MTVSFDMRKKTTALLPGEVRTEGNRYIWDWKVRAAYVNFKGSAVRKGIPMQLSIVEFWQLWQDHWEQRGEFRLGLYRKNMQGPVAVDNLEVMTRKEAAARRRA